MTVPILCIVCMLLLLWVYVLKTENKTLHQITGTMKKQRQRETGSRSAYAVKGTRSYKIGK